MYELEKKLAIAAVSQAAKFCQKIRNHENTQTVTKADTSPVTIADFGAQALICQALMEAFPDDPVIGEEDARMLRKPEFSTVLNALTEEIKLFQKQATSEAILSWIDRGNGKIAERYWTLDPIDGTKGFLRGDQYAIALALIENGVVKLGILGCPALPFDYRKPQQDQGVIFLAIEGQGTQMISLNNGQSFPLKVNYTSNLTEISIIESIESSHSDHAQHLRISQTLGLRKNALKMDSQAKYGAVARGEADLYFRIPYAHQTDHKENIWDHAAGAIIVTEAGGKVTDLDGKPFDFSQGSKLSNNRGILASNGSIHQEILTMIKQLGI